MFEFLHSKHFNTIFSFILGFALMSLIRPICKDCEVHKAPPVDEVNKSTYQLGSKCYQFRSTPTECGTSGSIESFIDVVTLY